MSEEVELRVHGDDRLPTLVYVPGLHGDWTLVGRFRRALADRVRFVELTYPRTLTWSLEDYAAAVEARLEERGITSGWLLGESFGSQVVWPLVRRKRFDAQGVILAGGFVQHPARWLVRLAGQLVGNLPHRMIVRGLFGYAHVARFRYRHDPFTKSALDEFIARRTKPDVLAAVHRLRLILWTDPSEAARGVNVPVFALTGLWDPVVPWPWVRRWLRRNCPALREYVVVGHSDHNILNNASQEAARRVLGWMGLRDEG